jgi:hypothetical protein
LFARCVIGCVIRCFVRGVVRYQGTFLRMPNLTSSASATATIKAQLSSDIEVFLFGGVLIDVFVGIGIFPPSRRGQRRLHK